MPFRFLTSRTTPDPQLRPLNPGSADLCVPIALVLSTTRRSRSEISGSPLGWRAWITCLVLFLAGGVAAAADKVDVVYLKNGDRITCEIKNLDRSVLTISTDPLGKASVHWGEIRELRSPRKFDVQLSSGDHLLGTLLASPPGQLVLQFDSGGTGTVPLADVIRLAPIGRRWWTRIDGNLDVGFSFAQADLETHWTLNGAAGYRSVKYQVNTTVASQVTTREDDDSLSRNSVGINAYRSFGNRWYTIGWSQLQQNQELSLDLRAVGGGGFGRDLVHTTRRLWSVYTGLAYTHEQFFDEPTDHSPEVAVGGELDFFTPGKEDFRITNSVLSYFNVGGRGRVRVELQSAWRQEFLKDFYWSLNGFESFDGDPPPDRKTNDFGLSFTLGWKF
jgi:Protein of unknown function, DUF481